MPGPDRPGSPRAHGPGRTSHTNVVVRPFDTTEWPVYRRLRLAALADAPGSFASTLAAEQDHPDAHWEERVRTGVDSIDDLPLLALVDDEPAGLVWGKMDGADPSTAHVYQMWVTPEHRRLGLGATLLQRVLDWARTRRASEVVLSVTCGESAARRLYERARFESRGEPRPLRPDSTLLVQEMRLRIS